MKIILIILIWIMAVLTIKITDKLQPNGIWHTPWAVMVAILITLSLEYLCF